MAAAYLAAKKLKGAGVVLAAARHNLREIQAERGADGRIDSAKSCLNVVMAGPREAAAVAALAGESVTGKLRCDAVRAVELVISLPPSQAIDHKEFFAESLAWARTFFGVPVLSAVVHFDESEPHIHILLLPLVDGRMVGSAMVGNRPQLRQMQSDFCQVVSSRHGLSHPMAAKRTNKSIRDRAAGMALAAILAAPDCLGRPDVRLAIADAVARNPDALVAALGLTMPTSQAKRKRSFVEIMTAPVKPEAKKNPIGFDQSRKHIGFAEVTNEKGKAYPCVGFASPTPADETSFDRIEDSQDTALWDAEVGEFRQAPKPPTEARPPNTSQAKNSWRTCSNQFS